MTKEQYIHRIRTGIWILSLVIIASSVARAITLSQCRNDLVRMIVMVLNEKGIK